MENVKKWKQEYVDLKSFVEAHPAIKIDKNTIAMMGEERKEFYCRLLSIKTNLVNEEFSSQLTKAHELIDKWNEAKEHVLSILPKVERVVLDDQLEKYMSNPEELFIGLVNKPLMEVFQGLLTIDEYEETIIQEMNAKFSELYSRGYEYWATLWLIDFLDPEEMWGVLSQDYNAAPQIIEMSSTGGCQDVPPWPIEVEALSFEKAYCCTFLTARMIVKSRRYNRFVAIRPNPYEPHWWTEVLSKNQEWYNFERDIVTPFGPHDLLPNMLIYVADDLRDLQLIQERRFLCRPHILVEFEDSEDWFDNKGVHSFKRHNYALRPKSGSIIISKEHFDVDKMTAALKPEKIDPATLGYWPEPEEEVNNEDPTANWPGEPDMNIIPVELGWNHEAMNEAFDSMIANIPPYPPVDW